ncbi:hypothetical protein MMC18_003875 [Xylographa bjoerkii]|nr:hypothetical protein [Xylographa bjoerkii]
MVLASHLSIDLVRRMSEGVLDSRTDSERNVAASIPTTHQVVVTSTRGVYSWTSVGVNELFRSGSDGIVAAAKASDDKDLIAVADRQVVILHDVKKGMHQSYRLKGADGRLRILRYQKALERLFFTTTLQNAVQSYSISEARILDSGQTHPSPPTVFAISSTPCLLVSSSPCPPTIYLQSLELECSPKMLVPSSTTAAVAVAAFHLERPSILVLGFVDGSIAVYNTAHLFHGGNGHPRVVEVASAENVHTIVTETVPSSNHERHSSTAFGNIGRKSVSITSIAFVPGSECTTVSVGADGKCCTTDFTFTPPSIRAWSIEVYATSLSVLRISPGVSISQLDRSQSRPASPSYTAYEEILVIIGCQDGNVLLYGFSGKLLAKKTFEGNARIIDVEWLGISAKPDGSIDVDSDYNQLRPNLLRTAFADAYALAESVDTKAASSVSEHKEENHESELPIQYRNAIGKLAGTNHSTLRIKTATRRPSPPEIPPRPRPRVGGQLALRHAKRSSINSSTQMAMSAFTAYEKVPNGDATSDQNIAAGSNSSQKQIVKTKSPTSSNAAKASLRKMSSIPPRTGSRNRASVSHEVSTSTPTEKSTDTVIDWTAASARRQTIPLKAQPGPKNTGAAYRLHQANHHGTESQSMASDDTIIDWNPPLTSKKGVNIHEDAEMSPAAVHTPVSRRSITARRKSSTPTSALSSTSLNPKGATTRKPSANLKQQVSRRSSKQQTEPSSGVAARVTTGPPRLENDDAVALQAIVELNFSMLQHEIVKSFIVQMEVLEHEIAKQFEAQKGWILKIMQDQDDWARKLKEENRLLRDALNRGREQ